jgi:hypothetical protein
MHTRDYSILLVLTVFVASCGRDRQSGVHTTQRDSAGVVIVENSGDPALNGGGWYVATEPSLSIGTIRGEAAYEFDDVRGAHRSRDGTIAVINAGLHDVRIFDSSGVHLRSFGRDGQGPGEFRNMALAGVVGRDTLVIVDVGNDRFSLVHPVAGFVRQAVVSQEVATYLYTAGVFSDGSVLFAELWDRTEMEGMAEGFNRNPAFYRSCNPDGSPGTDFGRKLGAEYELEFREFDGRPSTRIISIPFGKLPEAAVARDLFFLGEQDNFEIKVHRQTGELIRLIRLDREPEPVTEEYRRLHIEEQIVTYGLNENAARRTRRVVLEQPLPSHFPAHDRLVVDGAGFLWVQEYRKPGEGEAAWLVFDPVGKLVARLNIPEGLNLLEIGLDYLLGVSKDELDVEYVQLFAVNRQQE